MANPKITLSVDQSIIDTLVNLTAALNRVADSMSGVASATDAAPKSAKIAKEAMMDESVTAVPNPNAFVVGDQIKDVPAVSSELMGKAETSASVQTMPAVAPVIAPAPAPAPAPAMPVLGQMSQQPVAPAPVAQQPFVAPVPDATVIQQPAATMPTAPGVGIAKEQLMMAGVSLMDRGINANTVLWEFGVKSVDQLQKEQYGAFAERLRQLGAKI